MTLPDFIVDNFDLRFVWNAAGGRWGKSGIRLEVWKWGWEWTWR